jgi:WD40 repeat protein
VFGCKIWDLAKCCAGADGGLKLTLTGHISCVRGLAVSPRHPYLFSAGEDKMVKCKLTLHCICITVRVQTIFVFVHMRLKIHPLCCNKS